jgi:hypothetical protein
MNKKHKAFGIIVGLITAVLSTTTFASETSDPVIESCNNRANDANKKSLCFHYTDAFISGAETYDDMLVDHFRRDHNEQSDFLRRAYQTRLGMSHAEEYRHMGVPFCITNGINNQVLVKQVLTGQGS